MKNNYINTAIFPLKSIILPGGQFPLRIFERRYIDMVKECLKKNVGFVIALTKKDAE
jgi:Lon protease-like protein